MPQRKPIKVQALEQKAINQKKVVMEWRTRKPEALLASGIQPRPNWTEAGLPASVTMVSCANWWTCGMKYMQAMATGTAKEVDGCLSPEKRRCKKEI